MQLQEYQINRQERQQQMQELGFAMDLMSFETPQQKEEREWNYRVKQQEYANGNINSKDYDTRYKAALNSVQNLLSQYEGIPMLRSAEEMADDILSQGVKGISDLITSPGYINVDFADVQSVMKDAGYSHMGVGTAKGKDKSLQAAEMATSSPLLETSISGAKNVLLNITGGTEFTLVDMGEVSKIVQEQVSENANIILGTAVDPEMKDEIKVTLIVTGLNAAARGTDSAVRREFSDLTRPSSFATDGDVFSRKLKPGMESINVPSFFKPKN